MIIIPLKSRFILSLFSHRRDRHTSCTCPDFRTHTTQGKISHVNESCITLDTLLRQFLYSSLVTQFSFHDGKLFKIFNDLFSVREGQFVLALYFPASPMSPSKILHTMCRCCRSEQIRTPALPLHEVTRVFTKSFLRDTEPEPLSERGAVGVCRSCRRIEAQHSRGWEGGWGLSCMNSSIIAPLPFIFVAFHRLKLIRASVCTFFDLSQINFLKLCNDLLMMKVVLFPSFLHYTPSSPKIQKNPPQTGLNRNDCNKYCSCSLWLRLRLFLGPRLLA